MQSRSGKNKLTDRQEKFAQAVVLTGSYSEAYRASYSSSNMKTSTINRNASELMKNSNVLARVEQLRSEAQKKHEITVDSLLDELEQARIKALTSVKSVGASVAATMGKAKLLGVDKLAELKASRQIEQEGSEIKSFYTGIPAHLIAPSFGQFIHDIRSHAATHFYLKGGRGSVKSTTAAEVTIDDLVRHPDAHMVVTRKVFNTLRDSAYSQLLWVIGELNLADKFEAKTSPLEIKYLPTGQIIYFRGLDDPLKLKSIKPPFGYIRNLWFEELAELDGMETVRNVRQSLMRGGEEFNCIYSYNPPKSKNHWVNVAVEEESLRDDVKVYHSDYTTVPRDWLGEPFIIEAEHLKSVNELAYRHEYLGEAVGTGGTVFDNVELAELPSDFSTEITRYGVDFGFGVDPHVNIKCGYDQLYDTLYIFGEFRSLRVHDDEAAKELRKLGVGKYPVTCDSADPKSISGLQREGINAIGCKKFNGSREHGYKFLQRWAKIVVDKRRCPATAREFMNCEYEKDKDDNFLSVIPKKNDHGIDAVRYALDREIADRIPTTSTLYSSR